MSVGLLIITHNQMGDDLIQTATDMLGKLPLDIETIAIEPDANPDVLMVNAQTAADRLERGDGVLVLTDLYGSTPSNIAHNLSGDYAITVITGVNLPMLVRLMNYAKLPLKKLASKAFSGGNDGIQSSSL